LLAPRFLALPNAFAGGMHIAVRVYLKNCKELGEEPNTRILTPIVEALQAFDADQAE